MRSVRRQSIQEAYEMTDDEQVPEVPHGGARVRVRAQEDANYVRSALQSQKGSICSRVK